MLVEASLHVLLYYGCSIAWILVICVCHCVLLLLRIRSYSVLGLSALVLELLQLKLAHQTNCKIGKLSDSLSYIFIILLHRKAYVIQLLALLSPNG